MFAFDYIWYAFLVVENWIPCTVLACERFCSGHGITNYKFSLTHWGRVRHICVGNLAIIGSDNGLSPGRRQAIIWTNVGILLIGPLGTNCSEMLIEIHIFSFKKIHLKMSSGKWGPFCLGLNMLNYWGKRLVTWPSEQKLSCHCLMGHWQSAHKSETLLL